MNIELCFKYMYVLYFMLIWWHFLGYVNLIV